MELDKNRIAIRQREFLDVLDLALRVIRAFAGPLAATLALGIVPLALLNAWLLAGWLDSLEFDPEFPAPYAWLMLVMVVWEIPLATAPATLYLGRAVFLERPEAKRMLADLGASLPQLIVYQVFLRGLLVLPAAVVMPVVLWLLPMSVWPYLNEVILLERNPLRRRHPHQMTTSRRAMALHGRSTGDLFARGLCALVVGAALFASFWGTFWVLGGMLLGEWQWEGVVYTLYYPLALWLAVAYLSIVRFLAYLDLRIRREGWEIELLMRAEQARLMKPTP